MDRDQLNTRVNPVFLLAWIFFFPFFAAWPFLSALPAFGLIGASAFNLSTSLDVIFLLTGFWSAVGVSCLVFWLTNGKVRPSYRPHKSLFVGAYVAAWTGLYIIASVASR
jgi:hypothetical protein